MNKKLYKFGAVLIITLINLLISLSVFAQSPEKMSYQAVIRNSSDALVTNTTVGMQISILQGAVDGTVVYVETQTPTTNANGLISIEIGGEVGFDAIDWASGLYFIKTETDPSADGGTNYTITGVSQLLSVPYALYAKTAESISGEITETDPSVPSGTQIGEMQYWNGTAWVTVAAGSTGQKFTNVNGVPTWINNDAMIDLVTGQIWNDVTSTTGAIWMDRNLGAIQVATSSTDTAAYGDLYQWGRGADGHQIRSSDTTSTLSSSDTPGHDDFITNNIDPKDWRSPQNDNLWQGIAGVNNPCPTGYRLPTDVELNAERESWSGNNATGAFASPLKLPVAGSCINSDGSLDDVGSVGGYWSSTVDGTGSRYLSFSSSGANMFSYYRAYGRSVRCIKD